MRAGAQEGVQVCAYLDFAQWSQAWADMHATLCFNR